MKTHIQNQTQIITFSKGAIILKCCAIALLIACLISATGKITAEQFIANILDWDSI